MATNRNIQMNYYNGTDYDVLYPQSTITQIENLPSSLNSKLSLSGGTMTGNLMLNGNPSSNLQAATKQYVDNNIGFNNSPFKVIDDITLSFVNKYGEDKDITVTANLTADVDDILFLYAVISDFSIYFSATASGSGRRVFKITNNYFYISVWSDNPGGSPAFTDNIDGIIKFIYMTDCNSSDRNNYKQFSISTEAGYPRVDQGTIRLVTIGLK